MNANDLVFLGLKNRVTALGKSDGQIVWTTELPGGLITDFVNLSCDDRRVFAYSYGQIHCLDLFSGQLLWSNALKGHGYGIASICLHDGPAASAAAAYARISADQSAASTGAAGAGAAGA
jgi:outer membrane protein assembly factor BamB